MFGFFCCSGKQQAETRDEVKLTEQVDVLKPTSILVHTKDREAEEPADNFGEVGKDEELTLGRDAPAPAPASLPDRAPAPEAPAPALPVERSEASLPELMDDSGNTLLGFTQWEAVVRKARGKMRVGMKLDCTSRRFLMVVQVRDGTLISEWNSRNPDKKVAAGDAILSVNGATNSKSMIRKFKKDILVALLIRRVPRFFVHVDSRDGTLGLTMSGSSAQVTSVSEVHRGSIVAHNRKAEPGKAVVPGDILMSVNGETGGKHEIVRALSQASGVINLEFQRASINLEFQSGST